MRKLAIERLKHLKNNLISYKDLETLTDDQCIKVRQSYLYCLHVMNYQLKLNDQNFWDIIFKYEEVDQMASYLKKPLFYTPTFYLMSVKDIKYLIEKSKYLPSGSNMFIKSDYKVDELESRINKLKQEYTKKKSRKICAKSLQK